MKFICFSLLLLSSLLQRTYAYTPPPKEYNKAISKIQRELNISELKIEKLLVEGGYKLSEPHQIYYLFFRSVQSKSEVISYYLLVDTAQIIRFFDFLIPPTNFGVIMGRTRWKRKLIHRSCFNFQLHPKTDGVTGATYTLDALSKDIQLLSSWLQKKTELN